MLCIFRYANLARNTVTLHLVSNEHTIPENVISHDLASNNSGNDSARMDSNPHIKVLQIHILRLVADLCNDVDHFKTGLDNTMGFIQNNIHIGLSPILFDSAIISHNNVAITNGVNFIDLILLAKLVKSREHFRKQINNISWILRVLTECRKLDHICKEECAVLELVDLSLFIFDYVDHVLRYQLANKFIGNIDLHIEDTLVI